MNSIHFISLGCPKNLVDSEVMLGLLAREGFAFVSNPEEADTIIVNTCAFIEDAKKEAIDTILEMAKFKKKGACRLLVVVGCLPQRYGKELASLLPEVDLFVGAGEFHRIVELVKQSGREKIVINKPAFLYSHMTPRIATTPPHAAYIKIAEGCFHPCSFCVIPKIRGAYRSREIGSIVEEARGMLEQGVKEINLIAQDTTAYGRDLGSHANLEELLIRLANLEADKWIRLLYTYPHNFPKGILDVMKAYPDICPYLDIPIQHISNRILKSMNREGDAAEIHHLIDYLRAAVPHIFLRTSVIVGYPGETEEEFDELLDFISWAKFDHLGAFTYSAEEGTRAAQLKAQLPKDVMKARYHEIMSLQQEIAREKNRRHTGQVMQVLVEAKGRKGGYAFQARHIGQAPDIDGNTHINGKARVGEFALVKIRDFGAYDLAGDVILPEQVLRER